MGFYKVEVVQCRTPYLWREFKRLMAASINVREHDDGSWLIPEAKYGRFQEILEACEGEVILERKPEE